MKKLVLAAILGLGMFGMLGVASLNAAENLSEKQFNQLFNDCLENENKASCQRLANNGILPSVEQCDKNTCNYLGRVFDATANYQQAMKYYQKAGDLGDAFGYHNMGILYDNGQGVRQNFSTAKKYFGKACDLGEQVGCDNYKILNEQGVK